MSPRLTDLSRARIAGALAASVGLVTMQVEELNFDSDEIGTLTPELAEPVTDALVVVRDWAERVLAELTAVAA